MKEIKNHILFNLKENILKDNGARYDTITQLQLDFPTSDGWLVIDPSDLPADFSVETYTIENGQLVKASEEVIAERQQLKMLAQREAIRAERQHRYDSEAISSLYWNWVESSDEADKQLWIDAKNQVRQELPYPTERLADINKTIKNH